MAMWWSVGAAGCEQRKLTEADCIRVRDRVREVWRRDATVALREANSDSFRHYIKNETRRIGDRFMTTCRARIGSPVDDGEVACLQRAMTIDDVYECSR